MFYWTAHYLLLFLSWIFCPLKVIGRRNIPPQGSFIFASNHISNLDPMILGLASWRRLSYMAKESLFKNPIANFILRKVDAFPLNREGPDIKSLREALRRLKDGRPLVVFPAGTRGAVDAKAGVGFLVAKSQVPVIPAKIIHSDRVMPPGARFLRRHPVTVIIGEPMKFVSTEDYSTISTKILDSILALQPND